MEQEYINIFNQHREELEQYSSPLLNSFRSEALQSFQKFGFPSKKQENFKNFDVASEFGENYALNLKRVPMKGNPYFAFACQIPQIGSNLYYILNDLYNHNHLPEVSYPDGVFVGSLKDFSESHPDMFKKYYGTVAKQTDDALVAFNSMFVQDGFVVYVPKNTVIEKPIQLTNILKSDFDYLATRRVLVVLEENAQAKILSCDHTADTNKYLVNQVNEFIVGKNANLEFYELEENSEGVTRITSTFARQERDSHCNLNNISLKGGKTRNNYHVELNEEHAEVFVCGLNVEDKQRLVDNFVFIKHNAPNCTSTQLFKYILQDTSIGSFCGRIYVEKDAQKTLAYQSNNNLCVSPKSRMYSKPQLEIYADDVKCSHGLTTGQIDEDALFYMTARGISKESAKLMLMHAFAYDVIEKIALLPLREKLSDLVEKRLRNEDARCGGCYSCE